MNNYADEVRKRNRTLLIVEGEHEKNTLFWLIFKCFPEINIDMDNVWIYRTNIYMLYEDIVKNYGNDWAEEDIDLPFIISKKHSPDALRYKDDFTNIILVFDYERQDTNFSEKKIFDMQSIFDDVTDNGQLYINYPMIESYQHLKSIPDEEYLDRRIQVSLRPGSKYKELVGNETVIKNIVDFPYRINDLMNERFKITDADIREKCCKEILEISSADDIVSTLQIILKNVIDDNKRKTLVYQLKDWISKMGYAYNGLSYWQHVRNLFVDIIYHNIKKANYIQNDIVEIEEKQYKDYFRNIDLGKILNIQNVVSKDDITGFIWVLSTCIFFVPEYNLKLIQK